MMNISNVEIYFINSDALWGLVEPSRFFITQLADLTLCLYFYDRYDIWVVSFMFDLYGSPSKAYIVGSECLAPKRLAYNSLLPFTLRVLISQTGGPSKY